MAENLVKRLGIQETIGPVLNVLNGCRRDARQSPRLAKGPKTTREMALHDKGHTLQASLAFIVFGPLIKSFLEGHFFNTGQDSRSLGMTKVFLLSRSSRGRIQRAKVRLSSGRPASQSLSRSIRANRAWSLAGARSR